MPRKWRTVFFRGTAQQSSLRYASSREPALRYTIYWTLYKALLLTAVAVSAESVIAADEWPGEQSSFHSFDQFDFEVEDLSCRVVVPDETADGNPWIWRARFFGHEPQLDIAFLKMGYHIAYVDVADLFGSKEAVARWNSFYEYLTASRGFAKKMILEGFSRGGLIIYNWASKNPEKVSCLYGDAPVCDFNSWPGVERLMRTLGLTQKEANAYTENPIDNLAPLAAVGVPIIHVVGDADKVVPVSENTAIIEKRYKALGGQIHVIHKKGIGHHPHSLEEPQPIVDFILKHSR